LHLVELHRQYTDSTVAEKVLAQWPEVTAQFVKVMPVDYKRVLADRAKHDEEIESGVHGVPSHG
jgi:glutamate synthase domain-containing protein 3